MKTLTREEFYNQLEKILSTSVNSRENNFIQVGTKTSPFENQNQTNEAFSEKWEKYEQTPEKEKLYEMQKRWYLELYGFSSETELSVFLKSKKVIFDAGCGLGYKAAWFAKLSPESLVVAMDFSDAALIASDIYIDLPNLFFIKGDIANTDFIDNSVDYVSCDQVIMHTENPELTFSELARITSASIGEFACYFYAKKALPRELLDDYFRVHCKNMSNNDLWDLSKQLTELGKRLSDINVKFQCPEIPSLGIKAGEYDIQRFIYWNFMKCFWNEDLGAETSIATNFDWYSPSNAKRFSEQEVRAIAHSNQMTINYFHKEDACYSGRFAKSKEY
jgi:ubiquinone/menaquinone biosynthesis C-methylase UbiE